MELWYFGMSFAGSHYMDGLEGQGGVWGSHCPSPPEDQLQFGWLCSSRCDFQ